MINNNLKLKSIIHKINKSKQKIYHNKIYYKVMIYKKSKQSRMYQWRILSHNPNLTAITKQNKSTTKIGTNSTPETTCTHS